MVGDRPDPASDAVDEEIEGTRPNPLKIVARIALVVGALALSGFILVTAFDDLEPEAILDALGSLGDAEVIALGAMWLLWIGAQGLQTAALIPDLPVRRGVLAFLGPAAVASVIPGPSDLPVRFRMLTSWGRDRSQATLAVAAGGLFSIGIKLVLPVIAAVGLLVSDGPVEGRLRTVVVVAIILALGLAAFGLVLGSERRTARAGRVLDPLWRAGLRLLRREHEGDLATLLLTTRGRSLATLRGRWLIAAWGTALTAAARFALLLMALRFTKVDEGLVSWTQAFVVYALVQGLTVLPLTAGDAGVSEVALIGLLTAAAGADYVNEVTAAVIVFRALTWLLVIPTGLGALLVWRHSVRSGRNAGASEPLDDPPGVGSPPEPGGPAAEGFGVR